MLYRCAASAVLLLATAEVPTHALDGTWWSAQSKDRQDHFAAGFLDCSTVFPKVALRGNQYDVAKYVTAFYKAHPDQSHTTIAQVLLAGGPKQPPASGAPNGEVYTGKHGYFLGEYWSQMAPEIRSSFVQGELACQQAHHLSADPARAAEYTTFMNEWFDADNGASKKAAAREEYPIVHALVLAQKAGTQ